MAAAIGQSRQVGGHIGSLLAALGRVNDGDPALELLDRQPAGCGMPGESLVELLALGVAQLHPALRALQLHRGPVGDDLGELLADLRGIEADGDDRIGAHKLGVLDHAIDRMPARVLEQPGVLRDLARGAGPGRMR